MDELRLASRRLVRRKGSTIAGILTAWSRASYSRRWAAASSDRCSSGSRRSIGILVLTLLVSLGPSLRAARVDLANVLRDV